MQLLLAVFYRHLPFFTLYRSDIRLLVTGIFFFYPLIDQILGDYMPFYPLSGLVSGDLRHFCLYLLIGQVTCGYRHYLFYPLIGQISRNYRHILFIPLQVRYKATIRYRLFFYRHFNFLLLYRSDIR
jgi:hypothetical protein